MLKIKFWRIENFIVMKILEQGDEIERDNFSFKASNGVSLCSRLEPEIADERIYLRGRDISRDTQAVNEFFDTSEEAKAYLKAYIEAIKEYNDNLQYTTTGCVEDIETVIAE